MNTIISTKPYACAYEKYEEDLVSHTKKAVWSIRIEGGAGVVQGKGHLYTPEGVATEVDDKGLEVLLTIPQFQQDVKLGIMKVIKGVKAKKVDADEQAGKDMNKHPDFRPITEEDLNAAGAKVDKSDGSVDITGEGGEESVAKKIVRHRRSK